MPIREESIVPPAGLISMSEMPSDDGEAALGIDGSGMAEASAQDPRRHLRLSCLQERGVAVNEGAACRFSQATVQAGRRAGAIAGPSGYSAEAAASQATATQHRHRDARPVHRQRAKTADCRPAGEPLAEAQQGIIALLQEALRWRDGFALTRQRLSVSLDFVDGYKKL